MDSEYSVQGVINWENAIVAPWEIVESIKELSIVTPVTDGTLYREESDQEKLAERERYIQMVKKTEGIAPGQ